MDRPDAAAGPLGGRAWAGVGRREGDGVLGGWEPRSNTGRDGAHGGPAGNAGLPPCHSLGFESELDQLPFALLRVDGQGRVMQANPHARHLLGLPERPPAPPILAAYVEPHEMAPLYRALRGLARGEPLARECTVVHPGGRRTAVRLEATPAADATTREADGRSGPLIALRDVTGQRQVEEGLRRLEARTRTLLSALPDALFVVRRGEIVFANPGTARLLALEPSDTALGRELLDFVVEQDHALLAPVLAIEGESPVRVAPFELRFRRRDGDVRLTEATWLNLTFEGNPGLLCVARDVTERQRLQADLAKADRLSTVGVLASGVAHEINNPLMYVCANLAELAADDQASPQARQLAHDALEGAHRVRDIVRDLRSFARGDDAVSAVELAPVLRTAVELVRPHLRDRVDLSVELGTPPPVQANASRLVQVLVNLLVNAAQALPRDGRPRRIAVTAEFNAREVRIAVRDTGVGIAPEVQARLFEPFFTTKEVGAGSGLGLYVSRNYVLQVGGRIAIDSVFGRGTCVTVALPRAAERGADAAMPVKSAAAVTLPAAPLARAHAPARALRVLFAEDEPEIRAAVCRMLERDGHTVEAVADGAALIERIGAAGCDVDVVLCDLMMPSRSGPQVEAWLQTHRPELARRTGFLTGGAFTADGRALIEQHAARVLHKPFSSGELRTFLGRLASAS